MPLTPEPQRKYNQSDKGRSARAKWNKENRQYLEQGRGDRKGECTTCGQLKWLVRKHPPTCRKCNQKSLTVSMIALDPKK